MLQWHGIHRTRSYLLMRSFAASLSRRGFGQHLANPRKIGGSLDEYTNRHAEHLVYRTRYISEAEARDAVRNDDLRISNRYTCVLYLRNILSWLHRPFIMTYKNDGRNLAEVVAVKVLRFFSSTTLPCDKNCRYWI